MLALDSPVWGDLGTFGIHGRELPSRLAALLRQPVDPASPALDEIMEAIFHQHSLSDASYAVFPYLPEIHARYGATNPALFFLAANIAMSAKLDPELPDVIIASFRQACLSFERIAAQRVATSPGTAQEVYAVTVAALAFAGHCCGRLLVDVLEAEGTRRTYITCPHCGAKLRIVLFDEGAVLTGAGQTPSPPSPPHPLAPPTRQLFPERVPNPWSPVAGLLTGQFEEAKAGSAERAHLDIAMALCHAGLTSETPPRFVFSTIGAILLVHGHAAAARRFLRLWDTVKCSSCGAAFVAADGWWGCVQARP